MCYCLHNVQLEMIFGSCQSLLSEMRDVTIQVAANILEADAMKCEPRILEQQIQTLGKLKSLFFFSLFVRSSKQCCLVRHCASGFMQLVLQCHSETTCTKRCTMLRTLQRHCQDKLQKPLQKYASFMFPWLNFG